MNQALRDYYNSYKEFHEIVIDSKTPYFELLSLCQDLSRAKSFWDHQSPEIMERAKRVDEYQINDVEVLAFFYFVHARAVYFSEKVTVAISLLKRALVLLDDKNHRVLKSKVLALFGFYASDENEIIGYFDQSRKLMRYEFKTEYTTCCHLLIKFAFMGKIERVKEDVILIRANCDSTYILKILKEYELIDAITRGDHVMGSTYLKEIEIKDRAQVYPNMVILHLLKDEWDVAEWGDIPKEVIKQGFHLPFLELKRGNTKQALVEINKLLSVVNQELLVFLLRVELIDKNLLAAQHLMLKRKASGKLNYLDDLFLARIALLEKKLPLAAYHFHRAREESIRLNSLGMFNFELNLATEIYLPDLKDICLMSPKSDHDMVEERAKAKAKELHGVACFVGKSLMAKEVRSLIKQYSASDGLVLISGETGSGKEVVAKALHEESSRSKNKYLTINCGAISDSILQSELFGHVKGAYTGAVKAHEGIFEAAKKGTVFLDEIGEISMPVQIALLRVLESNEIRPVGSSRVRKISCKIIAATNAQLEELVELGTFRRDLYYRLNRLNIKIPALRERRDDVIPLAMFFLNKDRPDKILATFSNELKESFADYRWPGNVRELKSEIEKLRFFNSEKDFYQLGDWEISHSDGSSHHQVKEAEGDHHQHVMSDAPLSLEYTAVKAEERLSPRNRLEKINALFIKHETLTVAEISKALGVKPRTISNDLKKMIAEQTIERVCPTSAKRTFYFILKPLEGV